MKATAQWLVQDIEGGAEIETARDRCQAALAQRGGTCPNLSSEWIITDGSVKIHRTARVSSF
jgi:hypothetical protein